MITTAAATRAPAIVPTAAPWPVVAMLVESVVASTESTSSTVVPAVAPDMRESLAVLVANVSDEGAWALAPAVPRAAPSIRAPAGTLVINSDGPAFGRLLTPAEIASRLRIGRSATYELLKRVPGVVRIARSVRLPEEVLAAFIAGGGDASKLPAPAPTVPPDDGDYLPRPGRRSGTDRARQKLLRRGPRAPKKL